MRAAAATFAVEGAVRESLGRGDVAGAAQHTIRGYGPEVLGFLCAMHPAHDADEVFSAWSVLVWQGLPRFRWECSLRTWLYLLARNASSSEHRRAARRGKREQPLPEDSRELGALVAEARTGTPRSHLSAADRALAAFRDALPEDERTMLVLRLDRGLDWKDVARVLRGDPSLDDEELTREAQRIRKRFQLLKDRLKRELAAAGIAPAKGG